MMPPSPTPPKTPFAFHKLRKVDFPVVIVWFKDDAVIHSVRIEEPESGLSAIRIPPLDYDEMMVDFGGGIKIIRLDRDGNDLSRL